LAGVFDVQEQTDRAQAELRKAIKLVPTFEAAHVRLAHILMLQNDLENCIPTLYMGLEALPDSALLANTLAWLLATTPNATFRDPPEAVKWAEKACAVVGRSQASFLDTLACAYAAAGRFDEAVKTEQDAVEAARRQVGEELVKEYETRMHLFESRQPYLTSE